MLPLIVCALCVFLSTLSLRRATMLLLFRALTLIDFYPRSPCGERPYVTNVFMLVWKFLSTLSLRRATGKSTTLTRIAWISIHALLAESDCYSFRHSAQGRHFYPRSPCGERLIQAMAHLTALLFLSTLSLRRATMTSLLVSMSC